MLLSCHLDVLLGSAVQVPQSPHGVGDVLRVGLAGGQLPSSRQESVWEGHVQPGERP